MHMPIMAQARAPHLEGDGDAAYPCGIMRRLSGNCKVGIKEL